MATNKNSKQDDRLLKQLPRSDRKHQEVLRKLIMNDPFFMKV